MLFLSLDLYNKISWTLATIEPFICGIFILYKHLLFTFFHMSVIKAPSSPSHLITSAFTSDALFFVLYDKTLPTAKSMHISDGWQGNKEFWVYISIGVILFWRKHHVVTLFTEDDKREKGWYGCESRVWLGKGVEDWERVHRHIK